MGDNLQPQGAAVTIRDWSWRHGSRKRWALQGIDLRIEPGERVLLLGASGSGKSTLLQGLAGVLGGDEEGESSGSILLDGNAPVESRGKVGLVLQDPDSQVILAKVGDDVAFGLENLGVVRDDIWSRVRESLDPVGLNVGLDQPTSTLSGGQKQRLALAGVLAMRPGLLLLDEPTANLDPDGVKEVVKAVTAVAELTRATVVVVEHRVDIWLPIIDRVIVLGGDGTILADGTPRQVLRDNIRTLSDAGIWLPNFRPPTFRSATGPRELLVSTEKLGVGWDRTILDEITIQVRAGATTAITGPNGVGKTTLALTLAGLLEPKAGKLIAEPMLRSGISPDPISWRSRELIGRIGTVFQNPEHQFLRQTVRSEIAVGPKSLKLAASEVTRRCDELLERLRLEHLAEANPFTLSGGEKRRLSVATVLASRPKLLVLDEPTFAQDQRSWLELIALLAELLSSGSGILASTHDRVFVDSLADSEFALPRNDSQNV
ncbi:MAG: ATP-binding cassette domain-containing protein [Microbacteriaceae bacterium]|nr:ATP-binding cassette domain-containing protein [Microbacteriaceae bacterium]